MVVMLLSLCAVLLLGAIVIASVLVPARRSGRDILTPSTEVKVRAALDRSGQAAFSLKNQAEAKFGTATAKAKGA